jgi:hypothetical protein
MTMQLLIQLLLSLIGQMGPISALIEKMNKEGRTELTVAERAELNAAYASAHEDAELALEEARSQGR